MMIGLVCKLECMCAFLRVVDMANESPYGRKCRWHEGHSPAIGTEGGGWSGRLTIPRLLSAPVME